MAADTAQKRHAAMQMGRHSSGPNYPAAAGALSRAANLKLYAMSGAAPGGGVGIHTFPRGMFGVGSMMSR